MTAPARYKIKYLPYANWDIAGLAAILAPYPNKARRFFLEMERKLLLLEDSPFMWSVYHANPAYRRMNLEDHALFYIADEAKHEVLICRVIYARRDISKLLEGGGE
ncbi:MAG: type II toxin-antitoxin system RelE/ParE family toxin [Oscillospiraceae bacterium]|nr:type II toxin-antitoxin system RelE/ParE family toxin [Oscillospiraceae bacterium]